MKTIEIAPARVLRACFWVCCDVHARCLRYDAVNGSQLVEPMATCMTHDGYPEFIERPTAGDIRLSGELAFGQMVAELEAAA